MTSPTELAAFVRFTAAADDCEETSSSVVLRAALDDPGHLELWRSFRRAPPSCLSEVVVTQIGTDLDLAEADAPPPGTRFRIVLRKQQEAGELRMLLCPVGDGWCSTLAAIRSVRVAEMGDDAAFTTYLARFGRWTDDPALPVSESEPLPDPRKFTSDFTQLNFVGSDIRPWLLAMPPKVGDGVFAAWRKAAAPRLLAALADQVSFDGGVVAHFSGPPSAAVRADAIDLDAAFGALNAGAVWVFADGSRDADARHLLLSNEWARDAGRIGEDTGVDPLISARKAYAAYVKVGSKETLKAIAELRKTVLDETQKISQRAQDLAGALWKDLAIASAPFVVKIVSDSTKLPSNYVAGGFAAVAAIFLAFSFWMQVSINSRYFARQEEARSVWRGALTTVLSTSEVEEYSDQPIARSVADYKVARKRVGCFYGVLVIVLLAFAAYDLGLFALRAPSPPGQAKSGNAAPTQPGASTSVRPHTTHHAVLPWNRHTSR